MRGRSFVGSPKARFRYIHLFKNQALLLVSSLFCYPISLSALAAANSMSSPPPQQAQTSLSSTATAAPGGSTTRWRSESRTVRGSYDGDDRSRSRSVKAFGRLRSSSRRPLSKARAPSAARSSPPGAGATQTAGDLEKGKGGAAGQPQARPPWYSRKFRSPLEPLLKKIPMWLEGYIWGWIGGTIGVGL